MENVNNGLLFPTILDRALVLTHTNDAVDDLMEKVVKMKTFKKGRDGVELLVRVGIRGESEIVQELTVREIVRYKTSADTRNRGSSRNPNRGRLEANVVTDARIVFTTIGSMNRAAFLRSKKAYNVLIVEETAKISHGYLMNALSLAIGVKDDPNPGYPIPIVLVGAELQLPPFLDDDSNLRVKRLNGDSLLKDFVSRY